MPILWALTEEEILEEMEHERQLAELTEQKIELHRQRLQRVNARIRRKIAELAEQDK